MGLEEVEWEAPRPQGQVEIVFVQAVDIELHTKRVSPAQKKAVLNAGLEWQGLNITLPFNSTHRKRNHGVFF